MVPVRRIALFRSRTTRWIAPQALDVLLAAADVVSEGQFDTDAHGERVYLGSTACRISLSSVAGLLSGPLDAASAREAAGLLQGDEASRRRLIALAQREAEKVAGCPLFELQVDMEVGQTGDTLHLYLDVEGGLQRPARPRPTHRRSGAA